MEGKMLLLLGVLLLVVFVSGCIGDEAVNPGGTTQQPLCATPKKMIGDVCCFDDNNNNICDMDEAGCPSSCDDSKPCTNDTCSGLTDFKCAHEMITPCCGNDICDNDEEVNNICPEDCVVIGISDFIYDGTPDFIEDETFVFIHTSAVEMMYRLFFINITAPDDNLMENIRYTFKCNSTQNTNLDSIDSDPENITDDDYKFGRFNVWEDNNYEIHSFFFMEVYPAYRLDILQMEANERGAFYFKIKKKEPQKRDELSCMFKFYVMNPRKMVQKPIRISYI